MNDANPQEINHTRFRRRLPMDVVVRQMQDQFRAESNADAGGSRLADWAIALIFVGAVIAAALGMQ